MKIGSIWKKDASLESRLNSTWADEQLPGPKLYSSSSALSTGGEGVYTLVKVEEINGHLVGQISYAAFGEVQVDIKSDLTEFSTLLQPINEKGPSGLT